MLLTKTESLRFLAASQSFYILYYSVCQVYDELSAADSALNGKSSREGNSGTKVESASNVGDGTSIPSCGALGMSKMRMRSYPL